MVLKKTVLFTGITGLLGGYFLKNKQSSFNVVGVDSKDFNIINKQVVQDAIKKINPQIIIHAASIGNVDYCEKHPKEAFLVNVDGTKNVLDAAKKVSAEFIFLSSNAIYDGEKPPYHEKSKNNPVDIYGKTKVEAEKLIKKSGIGGVILRLITMYGWPQKRGRHNPVSWIIESLKKGSKLNIVDDVYNNHLWADQAAKVLWNVVLKNIKNDSFNIAGAESISRYELAKKAAKIFNLDSFLINPVSSDFFKDLALRPKNTSFDTKKMEKVLEIKPLGVDEGLRLMKRELDSKIIRSGLRNRA